MTVPGEEHERETATGQTGAPQRPKGEQQPESEAEKLAHGGGIDIGDVGREFFGASRETAEQDELPPTKD